MPLSRADLESLTVIADGGGGGGYSAVVVPAGKSLSDFVASDLLAGNGNGGAAATLLASGYTNYNNVIGGNGFDTVEMISQGSAGAIAKQPNLTQLGTDARLCAITTGYDNVCEDLAQIISSNHARGGPGCTHLKITGGGKHQGIAGRVFDTSTFTNGSPHVTDAGIAASDVGSRLISPGNLVQGTRIASVVPGVSYEMTTNWQGAAGVKPIGVERAHTVAVVNGTNVVTDPLCVAGDNGLRVCGPGWPNNTTITAVVAGDHFTTSNNWGGATGNFEAVFVLAAGYPYGTIDGGSQNLLVAATKGSIKGGSDNVGCGDGISISGDGNYVNGNYSEAEGANNWVKAIGSKAVGLNHVVLKNNATALGKGACPRNDGETARADTFKNVAGDRQEREGTLFASTVDATVTSLLDAGGSHCVIPANGLDRCRIRVVAHQTNGTGQEAWDVDVTIAKVGAANTAIAAGFPAAVITKLGTSAWALAVAVGFGSSFHLNFTGEAAKNIEIKAWYVIDEVVG